MKTHHCAIALAAIIAGTPMHAAAVLVSDLGWMTGSWIGSQSDGATYESHYTDPGGGIIVGSSKESRNGRAVGYDFEVIYEKEGRIFYQPHPNGRKSPHVFPLVSYDGMARRAVFENRDNDFPHTFIFEQPSDDVLKITLLGTGRDGAQRQLILELSRAL